MSARDDGWRGVIIQTVWDYTGCTDARAETTCAGIEDRLCTMPAADRLALMRALAPDGWVVARVPDAKGEQAVPFRIGQDRELVMIPIRDENYGWNACRAAMLASGEGGV